MTKLKNIKMDERDHDIHIQLDGDSYRVKNSYTLFECFQDFFKDRGICYHPTITTESKCNMCLIYDNHKEKIVRACEEYPEENGQYSLENPFVEQAFHETLEIFIGFHKPHCKVCRNKNLCRLRGHMDSVKVEGKELEKERMNYSDKVVLENSQCIDCDICLNFEKKLEEKSVLEVSSSGKVLCQEKARHNYSVNLVDLCPTGCFQENGIEYDSVSKELAGFCRSCDRLCETALTLKEERSDLIPIRQKSRKNTNFWLCDTVNEKYIVRDNEIALRSVLEKYKGDNDYFWRLGKLPSRGESWHFILPKNLPTELIFLLQNEFVNSHHTFEMIEENPREQEWGPLRTERNFRQKGIENFLANHSSKVRNSNEGHNGIYIVAPEIMLDDSNYYKKIKNLRAKKIVFASYYFNPSLKPNIDLLVPLPDYRLLTWEAENYLGDQRIFYSESGKTKIKLFSEDL